MNFRVLCAFVAISFSPAELGTPGQRDGAQGRAGPPRFRRAARPTVRSATPWAHSADPSSGQSSMFPNGQPACSRVAGGLPSPTPPPGACSTARRWSACTAPGRRSPPRRPGDCAAAEIPDRRGWTAQSAQSRSRARAAARSSSGVIGSMRVRGSGPSSATPRWRTSERSESERSLALGPRQGLALPESGCCRPGTKRLSAWRSI